jgi:type II secretory pathway pseudopilin PulG
MTLLELVIAMAMIGIIFAAILPQFALIRNSWDVKQGTAEALQNGRVFVDHIGRNLLKAVRITAVSESSVTSGYIQFVANDSNTYRYDISAGNYVEYGLVGNLSDLAGPVSSLKFTCYDACDLDTPLLPVTDVNIIRTVRVDATVTNSGSMGQDKTFTTWVYLRTNGNTGHVGQWKLDETSGLTAADSSGSGHDGNLVNMNGNEWTTGQINGALAFDGTNDFVRVAGLSNCLGTDYSVSWWAKPNQIALKEMILLGNDYSTHDFEYYQYSANLQVRADAGIDYDIEVPSVFVAGQWVHICGVGDANGTRVYIDGTLAGTTSVKKNTTPNYDLNIGAYPTGEYDFNGVIDDVCIYNRALSAAEIAELANILRYRDFTEAKAGSDITSLAISTPSSTAVGDLLIAAVATDGSTSLATPSDWTLIKRGTYSSAVTLGVWWKNATAAGATSHTFTWTGSQQAYGWMMRFTGHDPATPINVSADANQTSATPTSPAVTTTVPNRLILRLGAFDDDEITVDSPGLSGHTAITMDKSSEVTSGRVGWWKLNETGTTTTAADSSGSGNNGTLVNMTPASDWVAGYIGGGLDFDGSNDYVNCGNNSSLRITSNITVAAWVKTRDCGDNAHNPYVIKGDHAYALQQGWNNYIEFTIYDGGSWYNPSYLVDSSFNNVWHHLAGTYNGSQVKLYVDGVLRATTNHTGSIADSSYNVQLGKCAEVTDRLYNGVLDDVRIYNRALSATEIAQLATGTVSGGAGYVRQSAAGSSGTSTFSLGSSNEAQMLTIAIAPADATVHDCCGDLRP